MAVILEVKVGLMTGEKIAIRTGETKTFGRVAGKANFALTHDTVMSGLHFAVECGPQGPVLKDQNSTNGTFVNGARVKDAPLANGDEIRSGQTIFSVRLIADEKLGQPSSGAPPPAPAAAPRPVAPTPEPPRNASAPPPIAPVAPDIRATARPPQEAPTPVQAPTPAPSRAAATPQPVRPTPPARTPEPPRPAAIVALSGKPSVFTVGSWGFSIIPQGWDVKSEFGMEQTVKDGFPSSVTATEEMIGGNAVLGPFVESQLSMLRQYLKAPRIEAVVPPTIPGAEEKASVDVRYATNDGQTIFYRRLYARTGNTVGTVTLMTLDSEFASIRPAFDAIVGGIAFQVKAPA